ncbi:NAD(P)H-dependent oxidoreductase [Olivibacter sp. XZL3]
MLFQYPFYWLSLAAILKHWIDEVFQYQFAYGCLSSVCQYKSPVFSF